MSDSKPRNYYEDEDGNIIIPIRALSLVLSTTAEKCAYIEILLTRLMKNPDLAEVSLDNMGGMKTAAEALQEIFNQNLLLRAAITQALEYKSRYLTEQPLDKDG